VPGQGFVYEMDYGSLCPGQGVVCLDEENYLKKGVFDADERFWTVARDV
jgi:hypothetical protein